MINKPEFRLLMGVICSIIPAPKYTTGHVGLLGLNLLIDAIHFRRIAATDVEKPNSQVYTIMSITFLFYQFYLNYEGMGGSKKSLFNIYAHIILTVGHGFIFNKSIIQFFKQARGHAIAQDEVIAPVERKIAI